MRPEVIIIGAGAAGLNAARILSRNGCSVEILEARNRLGGRILTHRDGKLGKAIEMGAEFVHGRPDATWKLLRESGLVAIDLPFDHRVRRRGRLIKLPDAEMELGKVMRGLVQIGRRDMSFADYLRQHHGKESNAEARDFTVNFVQGFDAADPERISAKSLAEERAG